MAEGYLDLKQVCAGQNHVRDQSRTTPGDIEVEFPPEDLIQSLITTETSIPISSLTCRVNRNDSPGRFLSGALDIFKNEQSARDIIWRVRSNFRRYCQDKHHKLPDALGDACVDVKLLHLKSVNV